MMFGTTKGVPLYHEKKRKNISDKYSYITYNALQRNYEHLKVKNLYFDFLDFSKAFYTVTNSTIFDKLYLYGNRDNDKDGL